MALGQVVLDEIARLRGLRIDEIKALPALTEGVSEVDGKPVELHVYREDSHDGRVLVVAKAFRRRFVATMAAAEGFAVTPEGALVELDAEERASLL